MECSAEPTQPYLPTRVLQGARVGMDLSDPGLKNMTAPPTSSRSSAIGAEVFDNRAVLDEFFRVSALQALYGSVDRAVAP